MTCVGVSSNWLESCGERSVKCVISARIHKAKDYSYKVNSCNIKSGKVCTYVTSKYVNCRGKHHDTVFRCPV